ncbi:hypothetical protein K503DRAFT_770119 [Rhizopogon vinicolor AM-OR11-026]|uniref:Uncharacterized protein n=1 Tax=Rhizopogon vinicolor AM-OR11-026 TaxID=1314800 RepID=A0A1B7N1R2_9AGAM|nr:hypothetical protein K503DRAFT_770119 [Rhizopogon vinicolor AM-OR11-026]
MTTNATNTDTTSGSGSGSGSGGGGGGGGIKTKLQGVAEVIHGLGENIRGTVLGTADRATKSGVVEKKHDDVAMKGREEFAKGMAKLKGQAPQPVGTTQSNEGQGTGTGVGTGPGGATGAGVTDQRQQGHNGASATEGKSGAYTGPQTTGGAQTAAGTGAVHQQDKEVQSDPGISRKQEGKGYDQGVPGRDTGQNRARGATDDRSQQRSGPVPQQQRADEQRATGNIYQDSSQQEGGRLSGTGGGQRGQINFQGIPQ